MFNISFGGQRKRFKNSLKNMIIRKRQQGQFDHEKDGAYIVLKSGKLKTPNWALSRQVIRPGLPLRIALNHRAVSGCHLQKATVRVAIFLMLQCVVASPALAQQTSETQRLLKIIEDQRRRLDEQETQIKEQSKVLEALLSDVKKLKSQEKTQAVRETAVSDEVKLPFPDQTTASKTVVVESSQQTSNQADSDYAGLKEAVTQAKEDWPGSFGVLGTDSRMKISGFVELDVTHDTDAILTPTAFLPNAIVTRDAKGSQGADGQTNFGVQASRLELETRTPLAGRQIRTFTAVDWFDEFTTSKPNFRLREAYGEINDIFFGGDLLLGQAWSTYTNLYAYPGVLDFQGPNALFGTRHPMLRWTKPLNSELKLMLAAEAPDLRIFEGASSASRWPDGVVALNWDSDAYNVNVQASFLARDLRADAENETVSALGWGASIAGRAYMPGSFMQDFLVFSLTYGEGIGGVLNDVPPDASFNSSSGELMPIPALAWFTGYQHWWNPKFYSVLSYGEVELDTFDFQAATSYKKTQYATFNLSWTPVSQWLFGVEVMYGSRKDKDGVKGSDIRTQFTSRFNF